jgi:hypothetical protein
MVTGVVEALEDGSFAESIGYRLNTSDGDKFTLIASNDVLDMEVIRGCKVCVLSTLSQDENESTLLVLGFRIITPEVFDLDTGMVRKR